MRYAYPCQFTRYEEDESVVSFPDVAGANTSGNDRNEALEMAEDALSVVLAGYMKLRRSIPVPSAMVDGQEIVAVNPIVAAKLELYSAMREQGITKRALAERLGLSDTTVGRLTDPISVRSPGRSGRSESRDRGPSGSGSLARSQSNSAPTITLPPPLPWHHPEDAGGPPSSGIRRRSPSSPAPLSRKGAAAPRRSFRRCIAAAAGSRRRGRWTRSPPARSSRPGTTSREA